MEGVKVSNSVPMAQSMKVKNDSEKSQNEKKKEAGMPDWFEGKPEVKDFSKMYKGEED